MGSVELSVSPTPRPLFPPSMALSFSSCAEISRDPSGSQVRMAASHETFGSRWS